jgi:hypothetical protein
MGLLVFRGVGIAIRTEVGCSVDLEEVTFYAFFVMDIDHPLFCVCLAPSRRSSLEAKIGQRIAPVDRTLFLFVGDIDHPLFGVRLTIFCRIAIQGVTGYRFTPRVRAFFVADRDHASFPSMFGTIFFLFGAFASP